MSKVVAYSSPATGAKTGPSPRLCMGVPAMKHYRRSTTNKAPRKRTFLVVMTKFNADLVAPVGTACPCANKAGVLSNSICYENMGGGDAGDNNSGRYNNGGRGGNGNDDFSDGSSRFPPQFVQMLLGAFAFTVAVAMFPAQSLAMTGSLPGSPANTFLGSSPSSSSLARNSLDLGRGSSSASSASTSPLRPRSKVMHVACKGSTLVVPLPAESASLPRLAPWQRRRIVDAPIELSAGEVAIIQARQYQVRENVRV